MPKIFPVAKCYDFILLSGFKKHNYSECPLLKKIQMYFSLWIWFKYFSVIYYMFNDLLKNINALISNIC